MDSVTHIVLGAVIGEAIAGRYIGRKAMLIGAVTQSIPDVDIIASFWLSSADNLLAHRGITHSILFASLITVILSLWLSRSARVRSMSVKRWLVFVGSELAVHLLLDSSNAYGTGLFEPFTSARISFHVLFVADPFFSLWSAMACAILCFPLKSNRWRMCIAAGALIFSSMYFLYAITNKWIIDGRVKMNLTAKQIPVHRYFETPTPLNNWLWYIVAEADSGYYIGYRSVFDHSPDIDFYFHPKGNSLLKSVEDNHSVKQLERFSQGYYTLQREDSLLVFNDLRFGQAFGWRNPQSDFIFRYYLQKPDQSSMMIQRGRFSGWNKEAMLSMMERIRGN